MWQLFVDYNQEVCGRDFNHLVTVILNDNKFVAISRIEQWVLGLDFEIKIISSIESGLYLGFIVYSRNSQKEGHLWIEALYIVPEMRYNGLTRALLASFPGYKGALFALHKSRRNEDNPMMQGMYDAAYLSPHPTNDLLEMWVVDWSVRPNPEMDKIRNKESA